jgi:hypothetical protein
MRIWTNFELGITICVGIAMGFTIALLFSVGCGETVIEDHEVLIGNFLGHKELMVVKKN